VDYDNQFYIDFNNTGSSSMRTKLQTILNQNGEITLEDVENSVRSTGYYNSSNATEKRQESRIQETRKIIQDAGLISDESTSDTSLKNSLESAISSSATPTDKQVAAQSWFATFGDSLDTWTGSATKFMKSAAKDVVNFFSNPSESLNKVGNWISSAFTSGESDKTPNPSTIDNSLFNLTINTDKLQGFASNDNNDLTQSGTVIGDADWRASMSHINDDGLKNVLPGGILSDAYRPGNQELSDYFGLTNELKLDLSHLQSELPGSLGGYNTSGLDAALADLTNSAINARDFLNIDPVVLDLNGDGVTLTSYYSSHG
jgi:hypothetical protein